VRVGVEPVLQSQMQGQTLRRLAQQTFFLGEPSDPMSISLPHAIFWFALARESIQNADQIPSLNELRLPILGPGKEEDEVHLVKTLLNKGLLWIDPDSPLHAIVIKDNELHYYPRDVRFRLSAPECSFLARAYLDDMIDLMKDSRRWPTYWRHEYLETFVDYARIESEEFWRTALLAESLPTTEFPRFPGYLDEALAVYSVGQIATLMTEATRVASRTYLRKDPQATLGKAGEFAAKYFVHKVRRSKEEPSNIEITPLPTIRAITPILFGMSVPGLPWYAVSPLDFQDSL